MRVNLARCFAAILGLTVATPLFADFGQNGAGEYVAPNKWNSFNVPTATKPVTPATSSRPSTSTNILTTSKSKTPQPHYSTSTPADIHGSRLLLQAARSVRPVSHGDNVGPSQSSKPTGHPTPQPESLSTPLGSSETQYQDGYSAADPSMQQPSPFSEAISAPWSDCDPAPQTFACGPTRKPLNPWFAGSNLLFWNMAGGNYQRFTLSDAAPSNALLNTNSIAPNSAAGYDVFFGRYLDSGRYGISANYLNFNPGSQEATSQTPTIGDYRAAMPQWNQLSIDRDGAGPGLPENVYNIYDGAAAYRVRRDVNIQGIELNLACFGIMGASRIGPTGCCNSNPCGPNQCGPMSGLKRCLGLGSGFGYTAAGGALARPCTGCFQVITTQGFRWFQFKDDFQFASTDAYDGYVSPTDMFYNANVINNLYGYQMGGRLVYCLAPCLTAILGGKAGIYGNDVHAQQRIGTFTDDAYVTTDNTQRINSSTRNTVLAGLGEIDLGLGYRLNQAWTLNGGYRMLYATGVATSVGSIPREYFSVGPSTQTYANDSLLLHGAFIGAMFNW